jgi:O-antigen ligase
MLIGPEEKQDGAGDVPPTSPADDASPAESEPVSIPPPAEESGLIGKLGLWYVYLTPLISVVVCVRISLFEGLSLAGWLWAVLLAIGSFLVLCDGAAYQRFRGRLRAGPWWFWIGGVWLSLLWCDDPGRLNVQQACQFNMPLLVGVVASTFVRTEAQLRSVVRMFGWSLLPLSAVIFATRLGYVETENGGNRDAALTVALIGCLCLAGIGARAGSSLFGWGMCTAMAVLSGSRTAVVALLLLLPLHPTWGNLAQRLLVVMAMSVCALALFYSPIIQERMFFAGSGSLNDLLSGDEVDTSGRLGMWPVIWDEASKRPILGAGVGAARPFVTRFWDPGVAHPHNEYLRIYFEQGLVGLAIFLAVLVWQFWELFRQCGRATGLTQHVFVACFLGFLVLAITSITDNTLIYNVSYTDPLFTLLGSAYGVLCGDGDQPQGHPS